MPAVGKICQNVVVNQLFGHTFGDVSNTLFSDFYVDWPRGCGFGCSPLDVSIVSFNVRMHGIARFREAVLQTFIQLYSESGIRPALFDRCVLETASENLMEL